MPYISNKDPKPKRGKDPSKASLKKEKDKELKLVRSYSPCSKVFEEYVNEEKRVKSKKRKSTISEEEIQEKVAEIWEENKTGKWSPLWLQTTANRNFYDAEETSVVACFVNAIFLTNPSRWFPNMVVGGEDSVFGIVIFANVKGTKKKDGPVAILKVAKEKSHDDLTLHEAAVGMILNNLRSLIPNFAYIYGTFYCRRPSNRRGVSVRLDCNQKAGSQSPFVVYEPVFPSVSMAEYVKTCTFNQFLGKYIQVILSLEIAGDIYSYTHYDLHTDNVLIRTVRSSDTGRLLKKFYLDYSDNYFVETDAVATIIDYGNSYIVDKGLSYGLSAYEEFSVFGNKPFQLADAWKFTYWCIESMKSNKKCFDKALDILSFFTDDRWPKVVKPMKVFYNAKTSKYRHRDLIAYLRKLYPSLIVSTPKKGIPILSSESS